MSDPTPIPETKRAPSGQTPDPNDLRGRERREGWAVPLDRVEAFTSGAALSVEPERIEQELMGLWRKAAERARDSGGRLAVARACLWNLVVHSDGEEEFHRTKRILDEVSETLPTRIIALHELGDDSESDDVVGDDGTPLRAFVEANYRRVSGRREVVAEEITLEATRPQTRRWPALVRSLLLGDVPTTLVVRNPAADYSWLPPLVRDADRIVFDTGKVESGSGLLQVAVTLKRLIASGNTQPVECADLGWLRLWPWRSLIASMFDGPTASAALQAVDEIHLEYVPGAESAALLLGGWLMGRLQLGLGEDEPGPGGELGLRSASGRAVTLRLTEGTAQTTPVGIEKVRLRAGDQVFCADGVITSGTPCIELRSPLQPERVQPVAGRRDSELLIAAMGVGGRDPLMYEALRLGAKLAQRRGAAAVAAGHEAG